MGRLNERLLRHLVKDGLEDLAAGTRMRRVARRSPRNTAAIAGLLRKFADEHRAAGRRHMEGELLRVAVELCRESGSAVEAELGLSLAHYAFHCNGVGVSALNDAREAVELLERHRDDQVVGYAVALGALSDALLLADLPEDAVDAARRAVEVTRRMPDNDPALLWALRRWWVHLERAGHLEELPPVMDEITALEARLT